MKRTLLAVVPLACMSVTSLANAQVASHEHKSAPAQKDGNPFDGIYVGAEGGILNSFANMDSTTSANFATNYIYENSNFSVPQSLSLNRDGNYNHNFGAGAFSIGFGKLLQRKGYLGGELALNIANKNTSHAEKTVETLLPIIGSGISNGVLNTYTKAKLNFAEFDIDIKPGVVLNPNMLVFARVGAAFNQLKLHSNNTLTTYDVLATQKTTISALNVAGSRNLVGLRLGLGGEHFLSQNLVAKFNYVFTWYGNMSINGVANVSNTSSVSPITVNGLTNLTAARMNTQTVMVGLSYYFHDSLSQYFHTKT